jgi:hypothetical protein
MNDGTRTTCSMQVIKSQCNVFGNFENLSRRQTPFSSLKIKRFQVSLHTLVNSENLTVLNHFNVVHFDETRMFQQSSNRTVPYQIQKVLYFSVFRSFSTNESHSFVLYCIVLYCIVLYCIVLYCIVWVRLYLKRTNLSILWWNIAYRSKTFSKWMNSLSRTPSSPFDRFCCFTATSIISPRSSLYLAE